VYGYSDANQPNSTQLNYRIGLQLNSTDLTLIGSTIGYDWRLILNMFRNYDCSQLNVVDSHRQSDVVISPSHVCTTQLNSTQLPAGLSRVEFGRNVLSRAA
jgi:hypothetical protein